MQSKRKKIQPKVCISLVQNISFSSDIFQLPENREKWFYQINVEKKAGRILEGGT